MAEYEITKIVDDEGQTVYNYVKNLPNRPNDDEGMTADALKAVFDQGVADIKDYINDTLTEEVDDALNDIAADVATNTAAIASIEAGTVSDGSITAAKLTGVSDSAGAAVTTPKIADGAVTTDKLSSSPAAVTTAKIADGAVTTDTIYGRAVTGAKIALGAVIGENIGSGAVGLGKIATGAVDTDQLADGAVTMAKTSGVQKLHSTIEYVTLTTAGWSNNKQTVEAEGVTASNLVLTSPWVENNPSSTASTNNWLRCRDCGIRCIGQDDGELTFECETVPSSSCWIAVAIFD